MKLAFLDFEYNQVKEKNVNLVCCSVIYGDKKASFWLHNLPTSKLVLTDFLNELKKDYIFVSYSVEAEARSFIALGLNPLDFKWVDLYLE